MAKPEPSSKPKDNAVDTASGSVATRPPGPVLNNSMQSGEANKSMKKTPDIPQKPLFFKAKTSKADPTPTPARIENVVRLDTRYEGKHITSNSTPDSNDSRGNDGRSSATQGRKASESLTRKESLKEQYNKLQVGVDRCLLTLILPLSLHGGELLFISHRKR